MDLILRTLNGPNIWLAGFVLLFAYWLFVLGGLHEEGNKAARDRWIKRLREDDWSARYRASLNRVLDWIDERLSPEAVGEGARFPPTSARAAWSHRLLNVALLLALPYPLLSLTFQWAATGAAGTVGMAEIFPVADSRLVRLTTIGGLVAVIAFVMLAARAQAAGSTNLTLFSLFFVLAGAAAFASTFAGALTLGVAFAFVVTVLFTSEFTAQFAVSFILASAYASGLAGFGLFVDAFGGAGAFAAPFAMAFAFAFAIIFTIAFVQEHVGLRTRREGTALFIFVAVMLSGLGAVISVTWEIALTPAGNDPRSLILFLAVFPLLNGLTDFGSAGATRWLLRRDWAYGLSWAADIAFAALFFALLIGGAIAFVAFAVPRDGVPLLDIPSLITDLSNPYTRPNYYWLAFMAFSTLLPTILHLIVALSSTILIAPQPLRNWIADRLEAGGNGDWQRGREGKLVLCLLATVAMWWPSFVILYGGWWLWSVDHGMLDQILAAALWWHGLIA